jgi:hypothetical protein
MARDAITRVYLVLQQRYPKHPGDRQGEFPPLQSIGIDSMMSLQHRSPGFRANHDTI